ncbi:uncharacterized protein [Paramisgurnus dabryanus]|uniref:uncharacterized protein isoform X1 n=1 Tax=Paramisgurnus dabryanus TaxID=90735 RepID=UPI002435300D|nr:uncharacterized protein si:ch211-221j21.3 isoform X1 [Misgurnus anguillicaudatus]
MDCINPMQKKRRHSEEVEQWLKQSKRLCNGLGGCGPVEYNGVIDTPMDTWDPPNHGTQNGHGANGYVPGMQVLGASGRGAGQICPRCMAGEPGHINHIMKY